MKKPLGFAPILSSSPLFAALGEDAVQRIASACVSKRLAPGNVLFKKGDSGDALFGIRRGTINIETGADSGQRCTLNVLGPGDVFGEIALLDGRTRTADAIAVEECELFVLRRKDFLDFVHADPLLSMKLIEFLCDRLRWVNERMEEVTLMPLHVRMARRLVGLAQDYGSELQITQTALSEFVGASREHVCRQLQVWRRKGVVNLGRGRIVIKDFDRLHAELIATKSA